MSRGANQAAPGWSADFDAWADEALKRGDLESLLNYQAAPALKYAHPTVDHLVPMYVTLGLADEPEAGIKSQIDGFWYGLSKRSFQV
jgi:4,5-DOPA dioxygenase extradiol